MFTRMKSKGAVIFLIFLIVFVAFSPLFPGQKQAHAALPVSEIESIPTKTKSLWDKIKEYTNKALKVTVMNALMNVATRTTQKLAYDAAMYVSGGGSGGGSLIEPRGFKEYAQKLGEQAVGEFVGTLNDSWGGFNLCEPSPLQKLEFQKSFVQKIPKYKVGATGAPPAPKCDWDSMVKGYTALGESLDDFSIDIDVDFDIQEGEEVIWDTNDITGNVKKITDSFNKFTENLYNTYGVSLSKLWTNVDALARLLDARQIPDDWKNLADLSKKISSIHITLFKLIDEKVKALEAQAVSDEKIRSNAQENKNLKPKEKELLLKKTAVVELLEGELRFWAETRKSVDVNNTWYNPDLQELMWNKDYLKILLKHKLIDKEVMMKVLVKENIIGDKLGLELIKHVFSPEIKKAMAKKGDSLSQFADFMQPGKNKASAAITLTNKFAQKQAELAQKASELANNKGFKNVTDIVSGRIKTPATVVQEKFKEDAIKEPSKAKWSSITGAYFNADVGTALLNVALTTFSSTVFNNLMDKVYTGLFSPDEMINQNQVTVGLSDAELRKRYTTNLNSEMLSLNYELNTYNLLDEFIICPEKYETANNCVVDSKWAELLKAGQTLTIKEALQSGYLNAKWKLIPQNHSLNGDKTCYQKAYCYDNLQKLRRARILPVGFELAANLCADPDNSEYCSVSEPASLGEVVDNFYNCGQDDDHPYSIWCNLIDPNWLLKAPDMKCRLKGYGEQMVSEELPQRAEECVDDVSCIAKDENGKCLGWGYCTKEKNVWRFAGARSCSAVEDSCRTFTNSEGNKSSFLTNTLWLTDFNTCDGTNVGCAWYSNNKIYDDVSGYWQWADQKNSDNEAIDRIYFNNQVDTCNEEDEGCTRLLRATSRLGTNLLPNSSLNIFTEISEDFYSFDFWEATSGASLIPYNDDTLLEVTSNTAYKGLLSKEAIHIGAKSEPRYFIYSARIQVPAYLIEKDFYDIYNFNNQWSLSIDAYKQGVTTPNNANIYDLLGEVSTTETMLETLYLDSDDSEVAEVDLYLRFTTAPDVDRLKVALLALSGAANTEGNQVIITSLQLEEVGENDISPSEHKSYNSDNIVYVKKAPEYYNCYQDWGGYLSESQCDSAQGEWDELFEVCRAPLRCEGFAPYCTNDEVGCKLFNNFATGEQFGGIVETDDYCPEACGGYSRLYESDTQFSNGGYTNFIPDSAGVCDYSSVGCEEYTSLADDSGIESREYFVYERSCELSSSPDCQIFYTWDTPDASNEEINRYTLKGLNNEPVTSIDDSELCNEEVYNLGTNPNCYKFYAVSGGEDIDLSAGDSEYVSYHLIDQTITCSSQCKPYRLTRNVTEEQCLGDGSHTLNKFRSTNIETLPDGTEIETGICTVYTILAENTSCSAVNLGCREYRGSHSNASFRLLEDSFELGELSEIWSNGTIVQDAVSYEGHSLNNLNGEVLRANLDSYLYEGNLYLVTFWARSAVDSPQRLEVSLNSTDELLSGENGLLLDQNWQKFTLGPVMVTEDQEEAILTFSGISAGNLYIDAVNLIESNDYYYYIADSWTTPSVCDQVPGIGLPVPGYMLGCQAYNDNNNAIHYLKSFSDSCRQEAVGCELVIDTQNNLKAETTVYNKETRYTIGDLVKPIITDETDCLLEGYNWDEGKCHNTFDDAPIAKNQCELWGYYWIGDEVDGECVNESISDDVAVASDRMIAMVINSDYLCSADNMGCKAFGKPTLDADGEVMACNYGDVCSVSRGCPCRLEESNEYVCTVEYGKESCRMDTVYLLDEPEQYEKILCEANATGCDKFVDSNDGIWYFRNPGNRVCEYKEVRIGGQLKRGWFKKNSNEPCYENYKPQHGLWGFDHNLDYYVAGIDDLANYNFYTATCGSDADQCTNFIDPTAMTNSGNRNYYYIWDDSVDTSSCNGQVSKSDGCILFNNTSKQELVYSADKTYQNSFDNDMRKVGPVMGVDNVTLNPLTSFPNPYYLSGDEIEEGEVSVYGTVPYIDGNGAMQNLVYEVNGSLVEEESSSSDDYHSIFVGDIVDDAENYGGSGSIFGAGSESADRVANSSIFLEEGQTLSDLVSKDDIDYLYRDILSNTAENINTGKNDNNTNMVIKVERDRICGEWLDSGDSQVVQNADGNTMEVSTDLIACNQFASTATGTQCVKPVQNPLQKLDQYNYTLRGFGWDVLDYSGYSVPYMYGLDNYEQVYVEEDDDETVLGLNTGLECETASDCSSNSMNYSCINNTCYNIANGFDNDISLRDSVGNSSVDKMCRAYPRDDSPLPYILGGNKNYSTSNVNTCYSYTGYCVDKFTNIQSNNKCFNNYECGVTEQCVFNNNTANDDCLCSYKKVDYEEGTTTIYTDIEDQELSLSGLCKGGVNDGLPCQENIDCKVANRTTFRLEKESNINNFDGVCVYPDVVTDYYGLEGMCLEKASNGQCLTWYPVDRFIGDGDLYDRDPETGLASNRRYYCLDSTTVVPVLKAGYGGSREDYLKNNAPLCSKSTFGLSTDEEGLQAEFLSDLLNGKIYQLVDRVDGGGVCDKGDQNEKRRKIFYAGAVVNITQDDINRIPQDWPDGDLDGNGDDDHNAWGDNDTFGNLHDKLKVLYEKMQSRWQGQSCLYMLLDLSIDYPEYFSYYPGAGGLEEYWEIPSVLLGSAGSDDFWALTRSYPIIVTCQPEGTKKTITNKERFLETDDEGHFPDMYGIDPFLRSANQVIPKTVDALYDEIRKIYQDYDNKCDISFLTPGNEKKTYESGTYDDQQTKEALTRELYYVVNNVCEYHNIGIDGYYSNLYKQTAEERGDDSSTSKELRVGWVAPQGKQTVCNVLAEVIDDEGRYQAYTNRLSDYSNYDEDIRSYVTQEEANTDPPDRILLPYSIWGVSSQSNWEGRIVPDMTEFLNLEYCPVYEDNEKFWEELGIANLMFNTEALPVTEILSRIDSHKNQWPKISSTNKLYDINKNTLPSPFGAVAGNNLYLPYQISTEAIPYYKQHKYKYLGLKNVTLEENPGIFDALLPEDVPDEISIDIDLYCQAESSELYEKNQLFDLYETVYDLKSYKFKKVYDQYDQEIADIFSLHPYSSYSDVRNNFADPAFNDISDFLSFDSFTDINLCEVEYDEDGDFDGCVATESPTDYTGLNNLLNDDDCEQKIDLDENGDSISLDECVIKEESKEPWLEDVSIWVAEYNQDIKESNVAGFNAEELLRTKYAVQEVEENGQTYYEGYAVRDGVEYDQKIDLPAPIVAMKNVQNVVRRVISSDNIDVKQSYYKEKIQDNNLYNLAFYAQANRNALPIREVKINWGDGNINEFKNYNFKNHLPVCNVSGDKLSYEETDLVEDLGIASTYNVIINEDAMREQSNYYQGAAGAPENCVEEPFEFKHWYTDIKGYDNNGNLICKKGLPLDEDGNILTSTDQEDVVQCMLEGSIKVVDNFGVEAIHPFYIYVPLHLSFLSNVNLEATLYEPEYTTEGAWLPVYGEYTLASSEEEEEESGGFDFIGLPIYPTTP